MLTEVRGVVDGATDTHLLGAVPSRLCELGVSRLGMQGVGVALMSNPADRSLLCASGELAGRAEDLQFSLGEGPCLDAFSTGDPSLEASLAGGGRTRWPTFSRAALTVGIEAIFAFPLQVGAARFGVLDLARDRPGGLGEEQLADALALADAAAEAVLRIQADGGGSGADGVSDGLGGIGADRIVVHQATGMVAAQMSIAVDDALAVLRSYAYAHGQSLYTVAGDVVGRRVRFPDVMDGRGSSKP